MGLISARLRPNISLDTLNQAYQASLRSHTSFRLLFKKNPLAWTKQLGPLGLSDIKIFKNKQSFLLWEKSDLPSDFLYDMAVYKTLFKKTLLFKFHHLILDGISLAYFFQDLTKNYRELSSLSGDDREGEIYQKIFQKISFEEKQDREKKQAFWNQQFQDFKKSSQNSCYDKAISKTCDKAGSNLIFDKIASSDSSEKSLSNKPSSFFCVSLSRYRLKKLFQLQAKRQNPTQVIKMPYLLFSIYSKALQKSLKIESLILRTAFSARHDLKSPEEKQILASLSRSVPFFIPNSSLSLSQQALEFQKQAQQAREFLIMDKFPIDFNELKSYSQVKNQYLSLSMSYFYYQEKGFLGRIKSFSWQSYFQDIVLFMILSEKNLLLNFTYNPALFSQREVNNLYKGFVGLISLVQPQ